jgi:hypothetical protein
MSKKTPAKARAREQRKKKARLNAEEHQKKLLKQEAALWAFLQGEASAKSVALFLNRASRFPEVSVETQQLEAQLKAIREDISDFAASIEEASRLDLRYDVPVPGMLYMLGGRNDDPVRCVPHSLGACRTFSLGGMVA